MKKLVVNMFFAIVCLLTLPQVASASQTISSDSKINVEVTAEIAGEYYVTIPKTIRLDSVSKTAEYTVSVSGDIAGAGEISVVPEGEFLMSQKGKESITAIVTQDKMAWQLNEFDMTGNGVVSAEELSSGKWTGSFSFDISLISE